MNILKNAIFHSVCIIDSFGTTGVDLYSWGITGTGRLREHVTLRLQCAGYSWTGGVAARVCIGEGDFDR